MELFPPLSQPPFSSILTKGLFTILYTVGMYLGRKLLAEYYEVGVLLDSVPNVDACKFGGGGEARTGIGIRPISYYVAINSGMVGPNHWTKQLG